MASSRFRAYKSRFAFHSVVSRGAAIGVVCALVCWALNSTALVVEIENWLDDSNFMLRGRRPSEADIVIVSMDEVSLQEIRKPLMFFSPELAQVVSYLNAQGAAAIGVDFLLPDAATTMKDLQPGQPGDMTTMGQAVGLAGNVVLPEWFLYGEQPLQPPYEWYDRSLPSQYPWADLGFVDFTVDPDSCIRRQQMRRDTAEGFRPCLALALLSKAQRLPREWLSADRLMLDGEPIPVDENGCMRINYVGPVGSIRTVPFRDVLHAAKGSRASLTFEGATVLIGMSVGTFQDRYPTPFTYPTILQLLRPDGAGELEVQMSGVEIHANVLATLMDRAFITTPWFLATPLMLLLLGAVLGAIFSRCSLELGALLMVGHHLAWRGVSTGAFVAANWRVEMAAMFLLGILLYGTIFAMRWRWIRRMMGMVKSEAVARALEAGGARLDLGGQQRKITVLFCDIRNFTTFSERHSAEDVVRLLNAFFAAVVPALEAAGGTVNQYIGDAVMVIFGAPGDQPDHAARAVVAASEVLRRVHAMADRWQELGADDFRVGVGIHTGPAVVGTVGSPHRLDYTAIGDTVNSAARIESANKELNTESLISEATFFALPKPDQERIAAFGQPRTISVKGKQETLRVYAIDAPAS